MNECKPLTRGCTAGHSVGHPGDVVGAQGDAIEAAGVGPGRYRPIPVYRLGEMHVQSCGQSVSAPRGKAGARLNAHTELRTTRQRSSRETMYRNRPVARRFIGCRLPFATRNDNALDDMAGTIYLSLGRGRVASDRGGAGRGLGHTSVYAHGGRGGGGMRREGEGGGGWRREEEGGRGRREEAGGRREEGGGGRSREEEGGPQPHGRGGGGHNRGEGSAGHHVGDCAVAELIERFSMSS